MMGTGKQFWVDVSVEISHVIHMILNDSIGLRESEHPYEHTSTVFDAGLSYNQWTHKYGLQQA